jgi:hypothetical protein
MMYHVAESGLHDAVSIAELLDTFVRGFEDQITARISRLAIDNRQTFVAEPITLLFRGPARARTWQRAWKVVSMHEVVLRVTVEVDETAPVLVRGCVNSSVVAESGLGVLIPETSAHLSARSAYFRDRLITQAAATMGGVSLDVRRKANLVGHPATAVQTMRDQIERLAQPEPLL